MDRRPSPIIVALDVDSAEEARRLAALLKEDVAMVKVGLQLFASAGPEFVRELTSRGVGVFLDLKLHDIPNTVASAAVEAARMGASMLTLHTLGAGTMMAAARERLDAVCEAEGLNAPRLLGVTVLTSMGDDDLLEIGIRIGARQSVEKLADLAVRAGMDGIVASPQELDLLQTGDRSRLVRVIPGIRPEGSPADDQRRTLTPAQAIAKGADYLVIGRPITQAPDPRAAAREINRRIARATLD